MRHSRGAVYITTCFSSVAVKDDYGDIFIGLIYL